MRIYTPKDGREVMLCDMTDSHLAATIRFMERKANEGITVRREGGSGPEDYWYDEDVLYGKEALERMSYANYVKEQERRRKTQMNSELAEAIKVRDEADRECNRALRKWYEACRRVRELEAKQKETANEQ